MTTRLLTVTPLLSRIVTHLDLSTGKEMLLFVKSAAIGVAKSLQWIAMIAIPLAAVLGNDGVALTANAQTQEVSIKFNAKVGKHSFECGKSYVGLGKPATKVTFSDFRFYVSDVALIDNNGKTVPVTLTQDNKWQYQNVALLDFENKSGACANGTVETNNQVIGTVPKGNYQRLQFTLGVPFNLNHADVVTAPSPLNLTSLWWNWLSGYKFLRLDLASQSLGASPKDDQHSHHGQGFPIHLGSTGCQAAEGSQKPASCSNRNRVKLFFTKFDPTKNVVIADIAALVLNTNLAANQPNSPPGCMSSPDDGDCAGIMANLGIPFANKPTAGQAFFRVESQSSRMR